MSDLPLYDASVRHSIYVERHKARVAKEIVSKINATSGKLYGLISASDLDRMTRRQLDRFLRDIERLLRADYSDISSAIELAIKDFAAYEAEWQSGTLRRFGVGSSFGVPTDADLWAAVNARPFEGKFLKEWLDALDAKTIERVVAAIRQGYTDGLSPLEIARSVRGTYARKGAMAISKRGAEAMVRTAMAHTASVAKDRTYSANRAIQKVQWVSVLDHRTTPICRKRDGVIYEKGEGPRPPAHVGCRSTVIPVTKGNEKRLRERETYSDWLRRQSKDTQDDILGPNRGKLYREGGYDVDRFVDESGQQYTLDQLKAKDASTWAEVFGE